MRVVARVPGRKNIIFNSFEDLNSIWMLLNDYKNVELAILDDKQEVEESIVNDDTFEETEINSVTLKYIVPKKVTFTQRFQDRVKKEINEILKAVYPNMFVVDSISYADREGDNEDMDMFIHIVTDDSEDGNIEGTKNLHYLDNNVEFILQDIVSYYI